jgi:hypothetical protein
LAVLISKKEKNSNKLLAFFLALLLDFFILPTYRHKRALAAGRSFLLCNKAFDC